MQEKIEIANSRGGKVAKFYAVPIDNASWNYPENGHSMSIPSQSNSFSSSITNGNLFGNLKKINNSNLSTKTANGKCSNNLRQQQQQLAASSQECKGVIGHAQRAIIGGTNSTMTTISKSLQQRSLHDNNTQLIYHKQQQQEHARLEQEQLFFQQNFYFQIDLENDQQPLRTVHR